MADIAKTVAIIFQGEDKASQVIGNIEKGLGGISSNATTAVTQLDKASQEAEGMDKGAAAVGRLENAFKALAASIVIKQFVDANVEVERFERAMTLLKGSSEAAAQELEYIKRVTNTLGLDVSSAADAYTQLSAATKGTALEGSATRDIFEAVAKSMSSLGKSSADTQGALLAISQIVSKGTVSMEELRGQLSERLPGAFQIAAEAMGVTTSELDDLVSSGKLAAEDFLPKFADALQKTFGETSYIQGFEASFNRMQNQIKEAYVEIGKAGAFEVLTKGVQTATAATAGAIAFFEGLGKSIGILLGAVTSGDWDNFGSDFSAVWSTATDKVRGARDALFEMGEASEAANKATEEGREYVAFYAQELVKLDSATEKASKSGDTQAKALEKQAKEAQRAEEAAAKLALEYAKLQNQKDIKLIEASVQINIAQLEADTKKATAIIENLGKTIDSTGSVLGTLFGKFGDLNLSGSDMSRISSQIDKENKQREQAFDLQAKLTKEQIKQMQAKTKSLQRGDAMIKIEGGGLQPHLEAFMWEILRAVQVRVNQNGLEMLVGV